MSTAYRQRQRSLARLALICLIAIANQVACIPTDDQAWSDLISGIATDVLNQGVEFVLSFIRSGLAAFVL